MMEPIVVPLRSRRRERALGIQKIQHLLPAVTLMFAGLEALDQRVEGQALALAALEILTSGLLVGSMVRSMRAGRRESDAAPPHAHGVNWAEIFAAAVLAVEALDRWHRSGHVARPTILMAIITLAMGVFHPQITGASSRRRVLRVDDEGVRVGGAPFRTFAAPWKDIFSISIGRHDAFITARHGRMRRLKLSDLHHSADIRAALTTARERIAGAESPPQRT